VIKGQGQALPLIIVIKGQGQALPLIIVIKGQGQALPLRMPMWKWANAIRPHGYGCGNFGRNLDGGFS